MTVSKIAVIALVAIVAAPILLGYAMAVEEYTETRYSEQNYTNVTPLLQNSSTFDRSTANAYSLNSAVFSPPSGSTRFNFFPSYLGSSSSVSPIIYKPGGNLRTIPWTFDTEPTYYVQGSITGQTYTAANHVSATVYDNNSQILAVIDGIRYWTYDRSDGLFKYAYQYNYDNPSNLRYSSIADSHSVALSKVGSGNWTAYGYFDAKAWDDAYRSNNNLFVDLSKGYNLNVDGGNSGLTLGVMPNWWWPNNYVEDLIQTIDLNSTSYNRLLYQVYYDDPDNPAPTIGDAVNIQFVIGKVGDKWYFYDNTAYGADPLFELFEAGSNNSYQLKITKTGIEIRYVGEWPSQVAEANYYRSWNYEFPAPIDPNYAIRGINLPPVDDLTMRFDAATYRSYSYKITEDYTYNPSSLIGSNNIITKLENVVRSGTSINFGGNSYNVSNYDLMLGTHKVPLTGITFESTLNEDNTYDNKINGTVVSTTATPSNITFNGKWRANISSAPMEAYSYSSTKWVPGEFGWNGMDDNFLMVGLITSLGAFIGVGIYARRTKSSVWPLLIVCGGAALLFFVML